MIFPMARAWLAQRHSLYVRGGERKPGASDMARRPRSFEQQLAQVLDQIYETPYADGAWSTALTAVGDFLGAECVDLSFLDRELLECVRWESARIDAAAAQYYTANYLTAEVKDVHPRMPLAMGMKQGQVVADADFWTVPERGRKSFFAEYYGPLTHCTECVMGTVRRRDDGGPWVMLATHFRSGDPPQRELRNRVGMLLGHIRRAVEAEARLAKACRERDALSETLNRLGEAVAMLDPGARVVKANPAAEEVFRQAEGLRTGPDRRLRLASEAARDGLARALAQCAAPAAWIQGAGVEVSTTVVVPRPGRRPLVLNLQPLPRELAGAFGAVALLFISDPEGRQEDRGAILRAAYALSAAEAELTQALAAGETLRHFALRREVSYETARSQLRRVFDKTGVKRQAELVRVVNRTR
jgi:DNA-binding CsgD family transcriptional regulator